MVSPDELPGLTPHASLLTGLLMSAALTLFLYVGISLSCRYLMEVGLTLTLLIILSLILFWITIKFDRMSDLQNIISSTVSFDFRFSHSYYYASFSRFMNSLYPYVSVIGTLSGILLMLWVLPAIIIILLSPSGNTDNYIYTSVAMINTGICAAYFYINRDQFSTGILKLLFLTGLLIGISGIYGLVRVSSPF